MKSFNGKAKATVQTGLLERIIVCRVAFNDAKVTERL